MNSSAQSFNAQLSWIPSEFLRPDQTKAESPNNTRGLVFVYDPIIRFYILPGHVGDPSIIKKYLHSSTISVSSITKVLISIKNARTNSEPVTSIKKFEFSSQAMKILGLVIIMLLTFFCLVISKVYYFPHSNLETIAIPFGTIGLLLNLLVILSKGKVNIKLFRKDEKTQVPSLYFRHEIFAIINNANKSIILHGLEWNLFDTGRILQLSQKKMRHSLLNPNIEI